MEYLKSTKETLVIDILIFVRNGLAPTKNKYCDSNAMSEVEDK